MEQPDVEQKATEEATTEQPAVPVSDSVQEHTAPSPPPEPEGGYRFKAGDLIAARYKVIAPMGFGGFSQVYHCQDTTKGRHVAVKVLTEKKDVGLKEARAAGQLDHPHIVRVYDVPTLGDGTHIIVFGYIAGQTLEMRLDDAQYRRLALDANTLRIIHQVAEALD